MEKYITELLRKSKERYFHDCLVDGIISNVMMKVLNVIRRGLENTSQDFIDLWVRCTEAFIRWIDLQMTYNQHSVKNHRVEYNMSSILV